MTPGILKILKNLNESISILEIDVIPREDDTKVQSHLIDILQTLDDIIDYIENTYDED